MAQYPFIPFGVEKRLDVRVVAAQRRHHRTTTTARGQQGIAHGIPDAHERDWPGGNAPHAARPASGRTEGGEVATDTAALLHGQSAFLQGIEYAVHGIPDASHDEAVEQRDAPPRAAAGLDAPAGEKPEVFQDVKEAPVPNLPVDGFDTGPRLGNPLPGIGDRQVVNNIAVPVLIAAFPDLPRDVTGKVIPAHQPLTHTMGSSRTTLCARPA